MKKLLYTLPVLLALGVPHCDTMMGIVVLRAQVPATLTATWTPNPASDNVVSYKIGVDAIAPAVVPVTACTPSLCTTTITVPSFGAHVASLRATNLKVSTNPASLQDSLPLNVNFTLNQTATMPAGLGVQ